MASGLDEHDPDDPHGYLRLRNYTAALAATLADAGDDEGAESLQAALSQTMPSELLGDIGQALRRLLDAGRVPPGERAGALAVLELIREGFRRVGSEPTF